MNTFGSGEGNSGESIIESIGYLTVASVYRPKVICEIGVNLGHSTATWLTGSNLCEVEVYAFDIGIHPYVDKVVKFYSALLPNRFHYFKGGSTVTLPKLLESVGASWSKCDLFHVDGGHFNVPELDIKNASIL